jgi:aldehyde:ferredoxin oxidoreductase
MGRSAVGPYYRLRETEPGIDPLGPENVLVLALSVLAGAPISGQSRMTALPGILIAWNSSQKPLT